jgi:hypothetical protein
MMNPRHLLTPEFRSSVIEALKVRSLADAVEKAMYLFAALIAFGFLFFLMYFMGLKVFLFFIAFFVFLVFAKGMFVLLIK